MSTETIDRLAKLGFTQASHVLKAATDKKRKLAVAYEHFRYVEQKKVNEFNEKLINETKVITDKYGSYNYKQLAFTPVEEYTEIPPESVLADFEAAQERNCFDRYEVATIVDRHQSRVPDPILFGVINGCEDRFFISQWGSDVKIEDILTAKEG